MTNALALEGHYVTGIDLSPASLEVAKKHDATGKTRYTVADAMDLPFANSHFDVVCAMDILEHVDNPEKLIKEAARVLRPGGLLFFHTFNRTLLSYLFAVKGLEWVTPNSPKHIHLYENLITPRELTQMCRNVNLEVTTLIGLVPTVCQKSFWKLLLQRRISEDFRFHFTPSLASGYCGVASSKK